MKVRSGWSATRVPAVRRALCDEAERFLSENDDEARMRLGLQHYDEGPSTFLQGYTVQVHNSALLPDAELYWVTEPMARLTMDASLDVPECDWSTAPRRSGVLAFAQPLPPTSVGQPISVISWAITEDEGLLIITTWSRTAPKSGRDLGRLTCEDIVVVTPGGNLDTLDEASAALACFLASAWTLMAMPTLASRERVIAPSVERGVGRVRQVEQVTLVDLRPLRRVSTGGSDGQGRRYTHRWVVRGHWAHQPCGPGGSRRKLIYREPYIKGPEGAPLVTSERVMVWRR